MLLGGETQVDSYSPTSNGNLSAADNEMNGSGGGVNGNTEPNNTTSLDSSLVPNANLIQTSTASAAAPTQIHSLSDEYNKNSSVAAKDNNQNFLPENNLEMYQPQHISPTHISPRVQPYDLNVAHHQAHHHHLRSNNNNNNNNHMNQYNNNLSNGRKLSSPYKNQNLNMISHHQNSMYDGMVTSSSGNDIMVLKEEPENGY